MSCTRRSPHTHCGRSITSAPALLAPAKSKRIRAAAHTKVRPAAPNTLVAASPQNSFHLARPGSNRRRHSACRCPPRRQLGPLDLGSCHVVAGDHEERIMVPTLTLRQRQRRRYSREVAAGAPVVMSLHFP